MSLSLFFQVLKGGKGSGNFGHSGRPGKVGGSGGGGGLSGTYNPNVEADHDKDGVTDFARVGVGAHEIPPPPPVGRLPNLTDQERQVEQDFIKAYESDPDGVANNFLNVLKETTKPGEPLTFGTDDAKVLADKWSEPPPEQRAINRATLNTSLHQTANAIAKRAFVNHLDTLKPGDEILVTVGGCGAGKGYALKNVPEALAMKQGAKVVWDSAGDQNATENPWILKEAEKRGLKVNYVYVHADPKTQWADPNRGVVKRAQDPRDGRMVDAHVFADSYALGAKNHQAFYEKNKSNPNANFVFLDNTGTPKKLPGIPKNALNINRKELTDFALNTVNQEGIPDHVKQGASAGKRIWGNG